MANIIGDIILGALVIALNPLMIILVILLVLSKRGRTNSTFFLLGWFFTLLLMGWLVIFLAEAGHISASAEGTITMSILKLHFGILFLILAAHYWKKRPAPGQLAEVPPWMDSIENFTGKNRSPQESPSSGQIQRTSGSPSLPVLKLHLLNFPALNPGSPWASTR